jgi:flavin-dependent dehydrogenase
VVAAQEIEFLLDEDQQAECRVEGHRPELYFCRDLLGYGWCFRKGNYLNVGLGREDRNQLPEHVAAFCEYLQQQGRIPRSLPGKFRGHAYLLYGHSPREVVDNGVLLVGDAAGLAYAESGEGIRPAIESGLLAADVILAAAGDYRRERLEPYRVRLETRFGRRHPRPPARRIPSRIRQFVAAWLLANRWFVRRVVLQRWFLHTGQPPLSRGPMENRR